MKQVGAVEVPQEAFLAVLNLNDAQEVMALEMRTPASAAARARHGAARSARTSAPSAGLRGDGASARTAAASSSGARRPRLTAGARHLYVHLPFCAHAAATATSSPCRPARARRYVDALLASSSSSARSGAAARDDLPRRRHADVHRAGRARAAARGAARRAHEVTVEANPETVDARARARFCARNGVNRVSLGAQSFQPHLLWTCSSARARPDDVRRAFHVLRDAGFDNLSLDLIYGIPGQSAADLERDLAEALALEPEHVSATSSRRSRARASRTRTAPSSSARPRRWRPTSSSSSSALTGAGYRWYETANFCRAPSARTGATCARGTTSATGSATTTSGSASAPSAQSTAGAGGTRRRSALPRGARARRAAAARARGAAGRRRDARAA